MMQKNSTKIIHITVKCPRCGKDWTYPIDEKEPMPSPEEVCPTCLYDAVNETNTMRLRM